ncbi:MAG: hypothetical protein COV59_03750 [Candidatus Magasanikbacteria bacterium CG11_big_fil_rev_8_21_14_0_20_39_34]|uniref:Methyltransferase type 11 domain-containing protein n=1 Tax=Candidatus Magasanikbacteria bacterium CG11_big_fil_rev_8_21_14_0_20_39_34 TaxID=1974653 RepID=A0A2H0N4F2_9BACT|nr:MAG: hypothetical protein COV59_03750 [Candidatus Magasanikbacteria bacterium CG11_big_fil_rev_8_21_14_0_20_39_34]
MKKLIDFTQEVFKGRTIYRILFSWKLQKYCKNIQGNILDLGGGKNPTYRKYLPKETTLIRAECNKEKNPDILLDMNAEHWEVKKESYDTVFCHNTLYISAQPEQVIHNIYSVLKSEGKLFLTTPFIFRESPEPHDYYRFTSEKLLEMCQSQGFVKVKVIPFGKNFSSVAYLLYPFFYFRFLKWFIYGAAIVLDRLVPERVSVPLGFFVIAKK